MKTSTWMGLASVLSFTAIAATSNVAQAQVSINEVTPGNTTSRNGPQVTVNGQAVAFSGQPPIEQGGRVLVPLRGVLERIGAFVQYDGQTKTITAFRGETRMTLPVGSRSALVNDRAVSLDVPAQIVNGSTLVPLRFVAESLGADVRYDFRSHTVAINLNPTTTAPTNGSTNPTGSASSAVQDPATVETTLTGTVVSVFNDVAPRRLVVRTGEETNAQERTIPLRDDAKVQVRRRLLPAIDVTLNRVVVGDTVEIRQLPSGVATLVTVTRRARATQNQTANPNGTNNTNNGQSTTPATPSTNGAITGTTFKGEFLEATKTGSRYILKMTDGRLLEVEGDVPVFYGSDRVSLDDLRSGDQLTVAVDPRSKRGTRVTVAVEQ